ncbi:hypothetical protein BN85402070 [Alteracholeplasma palmae J233]|uniref:Uncharacterized protein n=1 Tax=Alteracholeplasma palmae (strain ATCC 49389 / J233) TaxID=1318466 RepID=U4KJR1_ALTPJ|nr:hypothetical protein [Alteracholeplasma palmae]CCV63784.1 hypothetical protein BN85402070 [Alteracholeplasma palmae J233]
MFVEDYRPGRSDAEIKKIQKILRETLPKKTKDRHLGLSEAWNDEKEKELQEYLDKVSEQYNLDFRIYYASTESLFPNDYKKFVMYG